MVQLEILGRGGSSSRHPIESFPCLIGRAADCGVRLDEAGVWDRHASLAQEEDLGFCLTAAGDGSLTINGEPARAGRLKNGDTFELGAVAIRFWMSPTRPKSHRSGDIIFWSIIGLVVVTMIALMVSLPR